MAKLKNYRSDQSLRCIICHSKVFVYDDRFKPGELVYWCPCCKEEGRKSWQKMADVIEKVS